MGIHSCDSAARLLNRVRLEEVFAKYLFGGVEKTMKRYLGILIAGLLFAASGLMAQDFNNDHVTIGIFANYYRFTNPGPTINYFGLGGRAGYVMTPRIQLEAEMAYDFERNYTTTFSNGITIANVTSSQRVLHGFFGPKFDIGFRSLHLFVGGKVGFNNFTVTNKGVPTGFVSSVGLGGGATHFALFPSVGLEGFFGWFGLRGEVGDDVFFDNGAHNNLRITFGPQFRF